MIKVPNEGFSSRAAIGKGIYLAENASKVDEYTEEVGIPIAKQLFGKSQLQALKPGLCLMLGAKVMVGRSYVNTQNPRDAVTPNNSKLSEISRAPPTVAKFPLVLLTWL